MAIEVWQKFNNVTREPAPNTSGKSPSELDIKLLEYLKRYSNEQIEAACYVLLEINLVGSRYYTTTIRAILSDNPDNDINGHNDDRLHNQPATAQASIPNQRQVNSHGRGYQNTSYVADGAYVH